MNPMVALSAEGGDDLTEGLGEGVLLISAAIRPWAVSLQRILGILLRDCLLLCFVGQPKAIRQGRRVRHGANEQSGDYTRPGLSQAPLPTEIR